MERKVRRTSMVYFRFCRHGQTPTLPSGAREDRLTPEGKGMARATGVAHLDGLHVDGVLTSGTTRSTDTIRLACEAAGITIYRLETVAAIGFGWIDDTYPPAGNFYEIERKLFDEYGGPRQVPISEWLKRYSHAPLTRARITEFLLNRAKWEFAQRLGQEEITLIGGSHGPTAATAVLKPEVTFGLDFADWVVYAIRVTEFEDGGITSEIVASEILHCPDCP